MRAAATRNAKPSFDLRNFLSFFFLCANLLTLGIVMERELNFVAMFDSDFSRSFAVTVSSDIVLATISNKSQLKSRECVTWVAREPGSSSSRKRLQQRPSRKDNKKKIVTSMKFNHDFFMSHTLFIAYHVLYTIYSRVELVRVQWMLHWVAATAPLSIDVREASEMHCCRCSGSKRKTITRA